ncbi:MAG: class I SAM-dependent methyltransferase [Clostridia bacterium]|nr:class I SAM-dependent methyltransferase [Clostridia bacterium]
MYQEFAQVYDALMDDVDYPAWAAHYLALCKAHGVEAAALAECACGTGSLTVEFAAGGIAVTGLDRSADMLRVATAKARVRGLVIPFVRQDMRALALHRPVDAVLATCDGVNYLLTPQAAGAFFAAAYAALKPGGGLFFDVSTPHKLARILGDAFFGGNRDQVSYLWQNRYDAAKALLEMELTGFVREANGLYRRFDEVHVQRAHTVEELERWLGEAGFDSVRVYGEFTMEPAQLSDQRWHVAALKLGGNVEYAGE